MQVLYVIDSLVPAGAERSLAALAPCYAKRGVGLDIVYLRERAGLHDELRRAGAQLFSVSGAGGRAGWVRRIHSLICERHPDLVHTTLFEADVSGRLAARWARAPVVSTLASAMYGAEHLANPGLRPWKVRAAQVVDAATARSARRLHAVSFFVADAMAHRLRFPRERIDVVPRGRDPGTLGRRTAERRETARTGLGVGTQTQVLLAVARQDQHKGLDVLVEALPLVMAHHADLHLFVAGRDGNQTPALLERVRRRKLNDVVTFLGIRTDVPDLLCAADVFVLPSRREGLPGSVLEAMALELPIVVSDLPQVREVVDDHCAELVPLGSRERLAAAITAVLSDRDVASERARRARAAFMKRFTIDRVSDEMLEFYERSLALSAPGHTAPGRPHGR